MRPRLLDLFCGEGGSGEGYRRAGWDVVGVDVDAARLRRNPGAAVQADALAHLAEHGHEYDAIHASPPCHDHTDLAGRTGRDTAIRDLVWSDLLAIAEAIDSAPDVEWVEPEPIAPGRCPASGCAYVDRAQVAGGTWAVCGVCDCFAEHGVRLDEVTS